MQQKEVISKNSSAKVLSNTFLLCVDEKEI